MPDGEVIKHDKRGQAFRLAGDHWEKVSNGTATPRSTPKTIGSPVPTSSPTPTNQPDLTERMNIGAGRLAEKAGGLIGPRTGAVAGAITRGVLPASNIQAGIDAAILASYGTGVGEVGTAAKIAKPILEYAPKFIRPAARLAGRLAIPAIGGAVGGATEGKAGTGAAVGAAEGLGGELISGAIGAGKRGIQALDVKRVGRWLSDKLPIRAAANTADLDELFRGGKAVRQAGDALEKTYDHVRNQLGNAQLQIPSPVPGQPPISKSLDEINEIIRQTEDYGYTLAGDPRTAMQGKAMRTAAHQMVEDTGHALNAFQKGLGDRYFKSRRQFATTMLMKRIFNEAFDKDTGEFSMQKLQQSVSRAGNEGYRDDLNNLLGEQGANDFIGQVFRGAKPTALDVPGHGVAGRAYVHGAMEPSFSLHMPQLAKHVGNLPFDLGRGRALAAGATLGPTRLLEVLSNYYADNPAAIQPVPPTSAAPASRPARGTP